MEEESIQIRRADNILAYIKLVHKRRHTLKLHELYNILINTDTNGFCKQKQETKIIINKRIPSKYNLYMSAYLRQSANDEFSISQQDRMRKGAELWKRSKDKNELCKQFNILN